MANKKKGRISDKGMNDELKAFRKSLGSTSKGKKASSKAIDNAIKKVTGRK